MMLGFETKWMALEVIMFSEVMKEMKASYQSFHSYAKGGKKSTLIPP